MWFRHLLFSTSHLSQVQGAPGLAQSLQSLIQTKKEPKSQWIGGDGEPKANSGLSQLPRLSRKQGNSLSGKTSLNLNSKFVFCSKVIAKKPVKQCRRQPAPNTTLTKRDYYQGMSQEVQSLSFVREQLNFLPGLMSTFFTAFGWVCTCSLRINKGLSARSRPVPCCIPDMLWDL